MLYERLSLTETLFEQKPFYEQGKPTNAGKWRQISQNVTANVIRKALYHQ